MNGADLRRDALVVSCAVSAGVHGALVAEHLAEGAGAGAGFAVATVALAACVVVLTRRATRPVVLVSGLLLAGLLASYALATTTGLPLLHPEVEPVDGLALGTKAVEALGLVAALGLLHDGRRSRAPGPRRRERTT
jgi:hypothetical protein